MDALLQDLRYAVRQLAKNPGFTVVAVVTLALGVGANTAVFSLANWVLLRPLPAIRDASQLAMVSVWRDSPRQEVSFPNYRDLAREATAFSGLAAENHGSIITALIGNQAARQVRADFVSGNYFEVLGVPLLLGRPFTSDESTDASAPATAIISHQFWTAALAGDPAAVGQTLTMRGQSVLIVGIASPGFEGTHRLGPADLWIPFPASATIRGTGRSSVEERQYRGIGVVMFGRIEPGGSVIQARQQVETIVARLRQDYPAENATLEKAVVAVHPGIGIAPDGREKVERTLSALFLVSGMLLVIAGANLTNLFVFRAARRADEMAVRKALGASAMRLARLAVVESLLIAAIAGAAGVLAAVWLTGAFRGLRVGTLPAVDEIRPDGQVVVSGILVTLVVGLMAGWLTPLGVRGGERIHALKQASARGSRSESPIRQAMAIIQTGASLALLVAAFLLVGTLRNLQSVGLGFNKSVRAFTLPPDPTLTPQRYAAALAEVTNRLRGLPGIESVALSYMTPFTGFSFGSRILRGDQDVKDPSLRGTPLTSVWVTPSYFETLGIPVMKGSVFPGGDFPYGEQKGEIPVVVSASIAREMFGERDPVGQTVVEPLTRSGFPSDRRYQVVGVVGDSRWESIVGIEGAGGLVYFPFASSPTMGSAVLFRSRMPRADVEKIVTRIVRELLPTVPVTGPSTLGDKVDATIAEQRLFARVITALTVLAVLLAGVGLYALTAFSVAERTREFGIRIAIGARTREIMDLVARQATRVAIVGIVLGLAGAAALARILSSRLFGLTSLEPHVYLLATCLMVLVVLLASLIPARAATRVDPMVALRAE